MKTISTIKAAFSGVPVALLCCLLTFSWSTAEAGGGCLTSTNYPSGVTDPSGGAVVTISTLNYPGEEYTEVGPFVVGRTYEFTNSAGSYITLREGTFDGPVVAAGVSPLQYTASATTNLFAHYTLDAACNESASTGFATTTVQDLGLPPCENSIVWPASAVTVLAEGNVTTINGCNFAEEYSQVTGLIAGNFYEVTATNSTYITVREGAVDGPVVVVGAALVTFTAATTADLYIHWTVDENCTTADAGCLTTTIEDQGVPPCENTSAYGTATASAVDGESVNIVGFAYVGSEYSTINGIQEGYQYQITHAAGSYITVRSGATDGAVLASGFSPLDFSGGADATVYAHYTVDASCTQDGTGSHSVDILSVGFPICENASQFPSSAVTVGASGAGPVDISTNQFSSGEYSQLTGITASAEYVLTHGNGVFITVRSGAVDGPVVGSGFSPLTIATTSTDDLYVHWNEDQGCNIDESGSFTTTVENLGVACVVDAGTITADEATLCLDNGTATITATLGGDQVVPTGWQVAYVLTDESDPSLPIVDFQTTASLTAPGAGAYRVHALVFDPNDNAAYSAETTGAGVAALLIENGGALCGSLDVTGSSVAVVVCPDNDDCDNAEPIACGDALSGSTVNGSGDASVTTAGIGVWYVFEGNGQDVTFSTCGAADFDTEITIQTGADCASLTTLASNDDFTGCAGSTSELTLYAEFGTTYYIHVGHWSNTSTTTGTFTLSATCACPDAASLSAGTLTANSDVACIDENGNTTLSATEGDAPVVPAGYEALYVLTSGGTDYVIEQTNAVEPSFDVTVPGVYTLHTLVYSSTTLDLGVVVPGTTTAADVLGIVTAEDSICAALDVTGATVVVTGAGSLVADETQVCSGGSISATQVDAPTIPIGYTVVYVLTDADDNNTILDANAIPTFSADSAGSFVIHTFVYNTTDIPDLTPLIGQEAATANLSLVQGGGSVCAALNLTGSGVIAVNAPEIGATVADAANVCLTGGSAAIGAEADGNEVVPTGYSLVYVLTDSDNSLEILDANATGDFTVTSEGNYIIHAFVYDPVTVPDLTPFVGQSATVVVAAIGDGTICAALDVPGSGIIAVDVCTGIRENLDANVSVYPNPSNGEFVVEISGVDAMAQLNVTDVAGRVVYTEGAMLNSNFRKELNLNVVSGTYLLQIVTEEGMVIRKLQVK